MWLLRFERRNVSSKLTWAASIAVLLGALAVVAWREAQRAPVPVEAESRTPQVVMFVDLSEENEEEGCGAIIHAVRAAAARGVLTTEVDTRSSGDQARRYRLLIAPAVVFYDERGIETARLEGEAPDTIKQLRTRLERLAARR